MEYYSLNGRSPKVSFQEAVVRGLAPDKGLYFPSSIPKLPNSFFDKLPSLTNEEIAIEVIKPYVNIEIPDLELERILHETLDFDIPVVPVEQDVSCLELYHGPTFAFKDVGARFMARCLGYFSQMEDESENVTVLVATSGDTGGAVAHGFYKVPGVEVVILYPKGKVSEVQEKQLTTLGENITAFEVEGTFDDCQAMVKRAFLDQDFQEKRKLTSANSINVARWLPQMFYYFLAYKQLLPLQKPVVFSIPSGNYGNICAGMMAQQMGLPIHHFVAGTNANKVVPDFLSTGNYRPRPSIATISNAMDVGDPSNFVRIQKIYGDDFGRLKKALSSFTYSDEKTRKAMLQLYKEQGYITDPHGAVGYLALKAYLKENSEVQGVFLETAHPIKFLNVLPQEIIDALEINSAVNELLQKQKKADKISAYGELKNYLLR